MKLVRTGENELRIQLTARDLQKFSITLDDFDYDSTKGRRVIWELFDRAREETGFDAAKEKVYIQLFPRDGGCELFVTKLDDPTGTKECYAFAGFDAFFSALQAVGDLPRNCSFWRARKKELFFIFLPPKSAPAVFVEFGEKLSKTPSDTYLYSQCEKVIFDRRFTIHAQSAV